MDIELGLVTKVVEEEGMADIVGSNINKDFFYGKGKPVFEFMVDYFREYSKTPSMEALKREFPKFEPQDTEEPLKYFKDELRERRKHNVILQGVKDIASKLEEDELEEAETDVYRLSSKLVTELKVTRDLNYIDDVESRIERYLHKKKHLGIDGIPTGITPIDMKTGGAHKGELITILARPGTGKFIICRL